MRFYNTLTKKIEEFIPNNDGIIKMYTCGPTVYHFAHIGNLRTYICEDVLEKYLKYSGYKVDRVMNITDVGHLTGDSDDGTDKMVNSAKSEHKSVLDIAKFYTDKFFEDASKLNIRKPDILVPATTQIDEYIKVISKLIDKGYAYLAGGNVYFDTSKLDNYYCLTNHNVDELIDGVRDDVTKDDNKRNRADFVLWFTKSKFDSQELKWDSPWGLGYPGWHIECSCISMKYLGEYLDIHCGGVDNIFPHHTNEIAQSEAYLGHKWCNYWFHSEYLNDVNGKMSKSNGDALIIDTLIKKGYNPLSYRYMVLSSHYQKPLLFSYDNLDIAQNAYLKLKNKVLRLNKKEDSLSSDYSKNQQEFKEAMDNNLNTSLALTTVYDVLKSDMNDYTKLKLINEFDEVLSLDLTKEDEKEELVNEDEIKKLIEERNTAKKNKDYQKADEIRNNLLEMGITIKDTRDGTIYERL